MLPGPLQNLTPQPHAFTPGEGSWHIAKDTAIVIGGQHPPMPRCREFFSPQAVSQATQGADPTLSIREDHPGREAYTLTITPHGLQLNCSSQNPWPGLATARQVLHIASETPVPVGVIEDAPALPLRGFMLDVSRDRVPTQKQLHRIVATLAALKYNHLELYTEHTFAYSGHESIWAGASPLTPFEVRELDLACASFGIELTANQNCLGHMHRWLTLPEYAHLAEDKGGMEHAFSVQKEPFSLCPTDPKSLALATDLIDQLLDCHKSRRVNVGLDETFDLGSGRSALECQKKGKGRVYLEYLQKVHAHLESRGAQMLYWGDIITQHPELVPELPTNGVVLLWGYEAGHPFQEQARLFAQSGLDFWIVPGTSSWQSLVGRVDNARANITEAARAALDHGAQGWLVSDWGDFGHWQPWPVSWPGLVLGAGEGWNPGSTEGADLAAAIDLGIPGARGFGSGIVALGEAHRCMNSPAINGTSPFFHLRYAHTALPISRAPGLTPEGLRAFAEAKAAAIGFLPPEQAITQELRAACAISSVGERIALARLGLGEGSRIEDVTSQDKAAIRQLLEQAIDLQEKAWAINSRQGGAADSLARLGAIAALLD